MLPLQLPDAGCWSCAELGAACLTRALVHGDDGPPGDKDGPLAVRPYECTSSIYDYHT